MRAWLPPLIGLPLGLALAGLAILWLAPAIERLDRGHLLAELALARPPAHAAPASSRPQATPPPPAVPAAATALPRVVTLTHPVPGTEPNVVAMQDPMRPPPGATTQASGTGFFVSARGMLFTAAHVVRDCRAIRIVSRHVPPTPAELVVVDAEHDIALLHAPGIVVPAQLAIGPASPGAQDLFVLGFPSGARRDVPDETWAHLVNGYLTEQTTLERNPGSLIWLQARDIAQGYSGGPVVDPGSGRVVGIVRALIDARRAEDTYGIVMPDLSIGPGAQRLAAVLQGEALPVGVVPASFGGAPALEAARRATVHVFCWN
jgi:S1-C subfamily serine protease